MLNPNWFNQIHKPILKSKTKLATWWDKKKEVYFPYLLFPTNTIIWIIFSSLSHNLISFDSKLQSLQSFSHISNAKSFSKFLPNCTIWISSGVTPTPLSKFFFFESHMLLIKVLWSHDIFFVIRAPQSLSFIIRVFDNTLNRI